jgi:hypothetical protein
VPFADDSTSLSIGDRAIENGTDRVALYGSLDITRDQAGQKQAAMHVLEQAHGPPEKVVETIEAAKMFKDPFT